MALYEVTRTDDPQPAEFVNAVVIASGTAQARAAVSHLAGVTKKNVKAVRMDTTSARPFLLSVYWDERDPGHFADPLI
ncbi:hypothetical protein OHA79_09510 [Streptomyces sp. NBC_00841]|uniref:hypothetical protein n=1 Tax=Streptomyces sp. NBC_00841 TaxID=2975847 RepID=UPI002DDC6EA8|nr:hypothetical protein [Streptomyces sp. NBC_00841]WRZ98051.1 hypothetical protein OHA79_09510 [Streptomyces sp. NBC_00841]